MEDEACRISSENEKPADLSFTCFQGEAWRVCHHYSDGIPANCQVFCPRGQPDQKALNACKAIHFLPDSRPSSPLPDSTAPVRRRA